MRPFDEYKPKTAYPSRSDYRRERRKEIDELSMTAAERRQAISNLNEETNEWFQVAVEPYREEEANLMAIFWKDCRKDLGYDEYLHYGGVVALEGHAWDRGHSGGFSEVYHELCDLEALARTLVNARKTK
mgnify:CR=1 FL=1